jgi:phage host-nuclease inhibitor protein Gam
MSYYVVIENGEAYLALYKSYAAAVTAVKKKHKEALEEQIRQVQDLGDIESILSDVNVPESADGVTGLYVEKGINIVIHRLSVEN